MTGEGLGYIVSSGRNNVCPCARRVFVDSDMYNDLLAKGWSGGRVIHYVNISWPPEEEIIMTSEEPNENAIRTSPDEEPEWGATSITTGVPRRT
jgi:hypothetical protein